MKLVPMLRGKGLGFIVYRVGDLNRKIIPNYIGR